MASSNPARPARSDGPGFDPDCTACPRLADFLASCRREHPAYHNRPVAPFGDAAPRLMVVGLAPGLHGANRSGRPFTGDFAGILLYETLHRHGFATAPQSHASDDGLRLTGARITNAVKCLPPANKPTPAEVRTCNRFLAVELAGLRAGQAVLALGRIAHDAVLLASGLRASAARFAHGAEHPLPGGALLIDSYHCSRYNQNTRRLTADMFDAVVARARAVVGP